MKLSEIKEFLEKIEPYEIEDLNEAKVEEISDLKSVLSQKATRLYKTLEYQKEVLDYQNSKKNK